MCDLEPFSKIQSHIYIIIYIYIYIYMHGHVLAVDQYDGWIELAQWYLGHNCW